MSTFTAEQSTKYQQLRDFLSQNRIPTEDFRILSADSTGTHCAIWNRRTLIWSFFLVTDLLPLTEITDSSGNVAKIGGGSPNFGLGAVITDGTSSSRAFVGINPPSTLNATLGVAWKTSASVISRPLSTPVEIENFLGSVANGTAETVETAGVTVLSAGTRIFYSLSSARITLTTAADDLTYIALKSHTGAKYLAIAFLGESLAGAFDLEQTADKIDIVVANQDTVAHSFGASWQALTP